MISDKEFRKFAKTVLSTYNLEQLNVVKSVALDAIAEELKTEFTTLNAEATLNKRYNFFKIPKTKPSDFRELLIPIPNKGKIICGIRHFSGKLERPFINISVDFDTSKEELIQVYNEHAAKYFEKFTPKEIRIFESKSHDSTDYNNCCMVQKAGIIKNNIGFEIDNQLKLKPFLDDNYYDDYVKEYQLFHRKNPQLENKVPYNDKDLMERSRAEGLLRLVEYNGNEIGLIAALKSDFLGNEGIYFLDIQIKEKWLRKGLAKSIQKLFVKEIADDETIIWGTIDAANLSSMKTASSNLRIPVRYETFVPI